MINAGVVTVSYIIATILFILALGGLSNQETARRGNWYGIIGMAIALIATILGVVTAQYTILLVALLIGGSIGLFAASRVQMTQMPELVAILHSLVGLMVPLCVRKLRVTGGEPLLRQDQPDLVGRLAAIEGCDDLAVTTNATLLPKLAQPLAEAGLRLVTVSLDSLDEDRLR